VAKEECGKRIFNEWYRTHFSPASWYAMLGLAPPVTVDQVKAAYRRKARECHPDHGGSDGAMAQINAAYEALLDVLT
jgi:DnaJ-class molecular chaperone